MRIFIISAVVCLFCPSCFMVPWDVIAGYEQSPATQEQFNAAMDIFYEQYPEYRVNLDILKLMEIGSMDTRYKFSDSLDFQCRFFRRDQIGYDSKGTFVFTFYLLKSKKNNIFAFEAKDRIYYNNGSFNIILSDVLFAEKNYKFIVSWKLLRAEKKMAKKEFETDILPKIQECLEIVRKKDKQKNDEKLGL